MAGNVQALIGCFKGISSCTASGVDSDWSATSPTATVGPTASRTITVPSGNSGTLKFSISVSGGSATMRYSKNGGSFTAFAQNDTVIFANGNTLGFEMTGSASGIEASGNVVDNTTGSIVGAVSLTNTS